MPGKPDVEQQLLQAAVEVLRPLIRQMLASGVVFGRLEARLRELFVRLAESSFALPGRPQTDSRISVLTGINRKEVRRIRGHTGGEVEPTAFHRSLAADLLGRWTSDRGYADRNGAPLALPFRAKQGPSFVKLVKETTSDLRPTALLDELVRTGVVEMRERRTVALVKDVYVPEGAESEKLAMLAEDPQELVATMLHNIFSPGKEPWLQQKVAYDHLGKDGTEKVRKELRRRSEKFLREVDRLLSRYDRDRNPKAPDGGRRYAGLGVYYFESPDDG